MNGSVIIVLAIALMTSACVPYQTPGSTMGGVMGGIAGSILDQRNPWRGGIIGATLGAIAGATIAEVSIQGSREAAYAGRPVEYRTDDNRGHYYAEPLEYDQARKVRKIRENIYVDGVLVEQRVRVIEEQERYDGHDYRDKPRHERHHDDDDD